MFYYEIPWIYQEFKNEILCFLSLYSVHASRILDLLLEINKGLCTRFNRNNKFVYLIAQCW